MKKKTIRIDGTREENTVLHYKIRREKKRLKR